MPKGSSGRNQSGFSLFEVLIVVTVGGIITVAAVPSISVSIANAKMRASMTSVSGLLQNTRMVAVQQNRTMTSFNLNRPNPPYGLVYYVKRATDTSALKINDPQVELEAPITPYPAPTGVTAPTAVNTSTLGFTPVTTDPSFNSRGLPCAYDTATAACPNVGFIKYFKDNRITPVGGWSAISISPAGRIKRWFWNGTTWAE